MSFNIERGVQGEQAAAEYLLEHGFRILHRNWRSGHYELDIVAVKDDTLHIVEVKCRRKGSLTAPEEGLTPAKQRSCCAPPQATPPSTASTAKYR